MDEEHPGRTTAGWLQQLVVGVDGSEESAAALRWASESLAPGGRLHAVHTVSFAAELAVDAVLGDSVGLRHRRESDLASAWIASVADADVTLTTEVVEGGVAESLLVSAAQLDADAVVLGHHPHTRFGPQMVGHVTADVLRHARRPVVVIPSGWVAGEGDSGDRDRHDGDEAPIVVGVGVAAATRVALTWATRQARATGAGISLVHALGPRSLFRQDGLLDVLAYHIDQTMVAQWVEEDLLEMADRICEAAGDGVELTIDVRPGRIGPRLVEAGAGARLLVIGREGHAFSRYSMASYLRHAIRHATCPVVVVPVAEQ